MSKLEPVIKWSGSKRSQAEKIVSYINKNYETYYELFCGGCSVLFYILNYFPSRFKYYVCNDINSDLISVYKEIKFHPDLLYKEYTYHWKKLNSYIDLNRKKEYFNIIRSEFNKTRSPYLFFFIMRTTTNGMPRYNKDGKFNNSFHVTRDGINPIRLEQIILNWSHLINKYDVQFISESYELFNPNNDDFLYLDPPYFNTKGMYYGTIDYSILFKYLEKIKCDYFMSFDGIAGSENNVVDVPKSLYNYHYLIDSGNSSFRRVIGKNKHVNVKESLYIKSDNIKIIRTLF